MSHKLAGPEKGDLENKRNQSIFVGPASMCSQTNTSTSIIQQLQAYTVRNASGAARMVLQVQP
jgi:hypothetical protein